MRQPRLTWVAAAAMALVLPAHAQTTPAADGGTRIEVTGSRIKRIDTETPSLVQRISGQEIQRSGYATPEDYLRSLGSVDLGSIADGAASGFVSGLSTISLRGFGSQGTLILINGRRTAPVAAVDINFGRGSLVSVNTLPKGAIQAVEIVKDGASAIYGSDAMAGVVNYILRKDYNGLEMGASHSAAMDGVGGNSSVNMTFGLGNLDTQRFNVFGGLEYSRRDNVMHSELKDRGNLASYNRYLNLNNGLSRFTADSVASFYGNYYRLPASLSGSTVLNGVSVPNNSVNGVNFLGSLAGCPAERTVGQGVPQRPDGVAATAAAYPLGMCRFNLDDATEAISGQERLNGAIRGVYQLNPGWMLYGDLMVSQTKTTETRVPYTMSTTLATAGNPNIVTWPLLSGKLMRQSVIVLPVGHKNNPTNGTAQQQNVQLIYRFEDLPQQDISELNTTRLTAGIQGSWGAWDIDSALLYSRQENSRTLTNRVRQSKLNAAIANQTYSFGGKNDAAALASIASDAVTEGDSTITSIDVQASRSLFKMGGGDAGLAMGLEFRKEKMAARPSDIYLQGDFIGLVANGTSGQRDASAAFVELRLPPVKHLEFQIAARHEKYSDFGDSTTGKAGFKWDIAPSQFSLRGTAATGFRAPSISQISDSFLLSFHSSQEFRVFDPIRCDSSNPAAPVSRANPSVVRDCNVLNLTAGVPAAQQPGNLPTVISANPKLQPETSRSATLGFIVAPDKDIDFSVDFWYFHRKNEIRVQRGIDLMAAYIANPAAFANVVLRDPDPSSWLPGVANSGPIIGLVRQYGNFNYSKTAGVDYEFVLRMPTANWGKFTAKVEGTYTRRFDEQILAGSAPSRLAGTSSSSTPKTKGKLQLLWDRGDWSSFVRYNHADPQKRIVGAFTDNCHSSSSAANTYLRENGGCKVSKDRSVDVGVTYTGFKNLTLSGSVLNINDHYGPATLIPQSFTFYDSGTAAQLGRRFNLNAQYKFW